MLNQDKIELIDSLQKAGILKIKIYAMIENNYKDVNYFIEKGPYKTERLNVRSVKVYADGALGSRGASMIDEYSDKKGYFGIIRTPIDSIKSLAFKLSESNTRLLTACLFVCKIIHEAQSVSSNCLSPSLKCTTKSHSF